MARGLDHIVHAVRDLDAAAEFYRRLGFTVGARNAHPWGTANHIVQLDGFFIELLTLADPSKLGADDLSRCFGEFHRQFLQRREGLSFLALASTDPAADAAAFAREQIARSEAVKFSRPGIAADGTAVTVGFEMAFAADALSPDAGFVACRQLAPSLFWNPAAQQHANAACGVASIVMVAENPTDHHAFLSSVTGVRELRATSAGVAAATPRGSLTIMDPTAFRDHFGIIFDAMGAGARFAAVVLQVRDLAMVEKACNDSGIAVARQRGNAVIAPAAAMGATLVFAPASTS